MEQLSLQEKLAEILKTQPEESSQSDANLRGIHALIAQAFHSSSKYRKKWQLVSCRRIGYVSAEDIAMTKAVTELIRYHYKPTNRSKWKKLSTPGFWIFKFFLGLEPSLRSHRRSSINTSS